MAPKPLINLGLFTNAGKTLMKAGKNGKAFVRQLNPFTGKMEKKYGHKAVSRRQGMLNSMKGVPMANRPRASFLKKLRK